MTSLAYRHQTFGAFRSSKSPSLGDVHIPCHQLRGFPRFPFQDLTSSATEWNTHRRPVKRQYMALAITQSKAIQFPSYTLLPDFLPFLLPSHSFSLQTSPFSQYEVLHSPQRAWPRSRCRCPTDYSQLDSRFLHAGYFNFRLLDSGAELPRRL